MSTDEWRSASEIKNKIETDGNGEKLALAYALSRFAESARLPEGYTAAPDWDRLVMLSDAGAEYIKLVPEITESYAIEEIKMAAFCSFYHHDLLIDLKKTDTEGILKMLNSELSTHRVRWPLIQGRLLYDKFNDTVSNDRIDYLAPNEVFPFLHGTPQGIFHMAQIVSGPLGFLPARQKRFHFPRHGAELWHCSDAGCRSVHFVRFLQPDVALIQIRRRLKERAEFVLGPPSEWTKVLGDIAAGPPGFLLRLYYDVVSIAAECIFDEDRTSLVERSLRGDAAPAMRQVMSNVRGAEAVAGSPRMIAERFSPYEQLQLLFTLTDEELVKLIDQAVFQQAIVIPANEERTPNLRPPRRYFTEIPSLLSSLGLRELVDEPIASLCAMLYTAYTKTANVAELDWRIRNMGGAPTEEALLRYLRDASPATAITELVLSSEPITTFIIEQLQYTGSLQSNDLVSHILWKVGFEVPRYGETYRRVRNRLRTFKDTILQIGTIRSEDDREKIRSAGVNLFVSIEQVLEELIAYNIWLLHSDHFLSTEFTFDLPGAKAAVASVLGAELGEFTWKPETENTLGTLYRYLQEASDWMKSLLSRDKDAILRPTADLPHYIDTHEKRFPFYHLELWADVHPSSLGAFVDDFRRLAKKFFQSDASHIRNGLDHQRPKDEFPSVDAMLAFTAKFTEALDHADIHRYVPKEFWAHSMSQDQFDRLEYRLRDYDDRVVAIYEPSFAVGTPGLALRRPMLVAPGKLLNHLGLTLTFRIREKTSYSNYWRGYPRRRKIPETKLSASAVAPDETETGDLAGSKSA